MRPFKRAAYIALAVLTVAVVACFLLRSVAGDVFLWIGVALLVPFSGDFLFLAIDGSRNGWKDEKILPNRMKREQLLIDLYLGGGKKKYHLDVYPHGDPAEFLKLLKDAAKNVVVDRSLEARRLGQIVLTAQELDRIAGQEIATSKPISDLIAVLPELQNFYLKNHFHIY